VKDDGRSDAALISVAGVLNAIYEEDFLGFSYGFRPEPSTETIPVNPSVNLALVAKLACSRSPDGFKAPTVLSGRTPCSSSLSVTGKFVS
jgi:hypothetical protein